MVPLSTVISTLVFIGLVSIGLATGFLKIQNEDKPQNQEIALLPFIVAMIMCQTIVVGGISLFLKSKFGRWTFRFLACQSKLWHAFLFPKISAGSPWVICHSFPNIMIEIFNKILSCASFWLTAKVAHLFFLITLLFATRILQSTSYDRGPTLSLPSPFVQLLSKSY